MRSNFRRVKSCLMALGLLGCIMIAIVVPLPVGADPAPDGCGYANNPQYSTGSRWDQVGVYSSGSTYSVQLAHQIQIGQDPNTGAPIYRLDHYSTVTGCSYGPAPAP